MTNATTAPQSCYPEEIETLRVMLDMEHSRMRMLNARTPTMAGSTLCCTISQCEKRIEALRTAIEALGGAL